MIRCKHYAPDQNYVYALTALLYQVPSLTLSDKYIAFIAAKKFSELMVDRMTHILKYDLLQNAF